VTLSVDAFEVAMRVKSMYTIKSWLKSRRKKIWKSKKFFYII